MPDDKKSYKEINGTTRVGDFLRSIKGVGKTILNVAGDVSGIDALNSLGNLIRDDKTINEENTKKALELIKLDSEDEKIRLENTKSARESNVKIQESENSTTLAKNAAYILDFIVVGFTVLVALMLFVFKIPIENKEMAYMLFGSLVTLSANIVNFHRGSSQGSKDKFLSLNKKP